MATAKKLALRLRRENRKNHRSWRAIAREDYAGQVGHAVLYRIATTKGAYLPKDPATLRVLGLLKPEKSSHHYHDLFDIPTPALRWMLEHREVMQ